MIIQAIPTALFFCALQSYQHPLFSGHRSKIRMEQPGYSRITAFLMPQKT